MFFCNLFAHKIVKWRPCAMRLLATKQIEIDNKKMNAKENEKKENKVITIRFVN